MATSRGTPVFEIYTDKKGEFRWRAKSKNGNVLAAASEGYKDKRDAVHCAKLFGYDPKSVPPAPKKAAAVKAAPAKKDMAAAAPAAGKPKRVAKPKTPPAPPPAES